jgi:large subunit ribosomal protein L6
VKVPSGVTVTIAGQQVTAKGKLGQLSMAIVRDVKPELEGDKVTVRPLNETKRTRMAWGMSRNMINNMVKGVSTGYTIVLEINGVGYRAAVQGKNLILQLGYSHEVQFPIPEGIAIKCDKPTLVTISGADKQKVGQVAAKIRSYRKPEPYKGKGIKYDFETIRRKEGKKK